jgi:hypothetical protein
VLVAGGLAACGDSHAVHRGVPRSAGDRRLAAAESVLTHATSVRVTTELHTSSGKTSRSVADIVPGNRMRITLSLDDQRSEIRLRGGWAYLRGNTAYWQAAGMSAGVATLLVPHWYKLSLTAISSARSLLALLHASTLGTCTLGLPDSTTAITSQRAGMTILTQRGDATTDRITLRSGSSQPISEQRTGPGASSATCGPDTSSETVSSGTTTFTRYGVPVTVPVPAHTLDQDQMSSFLSRATKK